MKEDLEPSKVAMQRFMEDAWVRRLPDACQRHLPPHFRHFMPGNSGPQIGPEPYQSIIDAFLEGFPDLTMTIEALFGEGDRVCIMWRAQGTHTGTFSNTPPTGARIDLRGVGVARVAEGRLVESISIFDNLEFATQLRVI